MYGPIVFQDITYENKAAGWVDGVYYPRISHVRAGEAFLERREGVLAMHSRVWQEIEETGYGVYYYEETTELATELPGGNYVVKTVLVNPGVRAYTCHIRLNGVIKGDEITVGPGEEREISFIACMTDGAFALRFCTGALADIHGDVTEGDVFVKDLDIFPEPAKARREKPHVFLVSDSTVQSYGKRSYPQTGWGQVFYQFFQGAGQCDCSRDRISELPGLVIENRAIGGRSARSFYDEGRLDQVMEVLCPGDFMFVQFAHNDDAKLRPNRYVAPREFPAFLQRYADACERRGAQCVFVTPVTMRRMDESGRFRICFEPYRQKMMELAAERGIPLLDLGKRSTAYLNAVGEEESRDIYLWAAEGEYPDGAYAAGVSDDAHLQEYGAKVYANLVARMIVEYDRDDRLDALKRLAEPKAEGEIERPRRRAVPPDSAAETTVTGFVVQEVSLENGRGNFLLNWNQTAGAAAYVVYARKRGETEFKAVKTVTREEKDAFATLPFSAEAGFIWQYCVAPVSEGGEGQAGRVVEVDLRHTE